MPVISATDEVEIKRNAIQDQPIERVSETPSQPISWAMVAYIFHPKYVRGVVGRLCFKATPGQK
jgi:hypothetical protein